MRTVFGLLCAVLLVAGCAHHYVAPAPQPVIKPDLHVSGEVAMVNAEARFVVITFPSGSVPPADQRLNVYRNGLKVAEVKVTGPERENDTVADIISGEVQVHDEVKGE